MKKYHETVAWWNCFWKFCFHKQVRLEQNNFETDVKYGILKNCCSKTSFWCDPHLLETTLRFEFYQTKFKDFCLIVSPNKDEANELVDLIADVLASKLHAFFFVSISSHFLFLSQRRSHCCYYIKTARSHNCTVHKNSVIVVRSRPKRNVKKLNNSIVRTFTSQNNGVANIFLH